MDSRFVESIIAVGKREAAPTQYGVVNDFYLNEKKERANWDHLKDYFEVAGKYTATNWADPAVLDGVRLPNKRVPQKNTSGIQWCGVFATYCWIKGGLPGVRWAWPGVVGGNVKKSWGFKGVSRGDIGVVAANGLNHHFIVEEVHGPNDDAGTMVSTINGNSDYQGVIRKPRNVVLGMIVAFYTYEDAFFNKLNTMYGQPSS